MSDSKSQNRDDSLSPAEWKQIEKVCDRFEQAWNGDQPPQLEEFLQRDWPKPQQLALLRDLLIVELDQRRALGEEPSVDDYLARFTRHSRVRPTQPLWPRSRPAPIRCKRPVKLAPTNSSLEKDRTRRYDTASALAEDVSRFLNHEPIAARPPSISYRMNKFVSKYRTAVLGAVVMLVLLLGGIASTTWQAIRARQQTLRAVAAQHQSDWRLYVTQIRLAEAEWEYGDPAVAIEALSSCSRGLRGWEHDYLYTRFNRGQRTLYPGWVSSFALSPDGKRIAVGLGETLKVVDAETGQEALTIKGPRKTFGRVAFSPDGKWIVSGSADGTRDGTLTVWDAETGEEIILFAHTRPVTCVAFSPDGKRIVSGSRDKTVKVWDVESRNEGLTLEGHRAGVTSVTFSPDGKRIGSGSRDNTMKVWDAETGKEFLTLDTGQVSSVRFSPDGKRIVSGGEKLKVWDAETGQVFLTFVGHTGEITSACFSPDGKWIVSGSSDKTLRVWHAETGDEALTLKASAVGSVAFSPDGKRIVSGGGGLKVWDAQIGDEPLTLKGHTNYVRSVCFSPDGKRIVSGSDGDKTLRVWDAETGKELLTLNTGPVCSVCFSPDGKRIVIGGDGLKVWDAETGEGLLTLATGIVFSVCFSPDGEQIVSAGEDSVIEKCVFKVWDAETGKEFLTLGHTDQFANVFFSPDGKRIYGGGKVWNAENGKLLAAGLGGSVVLSPDGKRIVSGGSVNGTLQVWDAEDGKELLLLKGNAGKVTCVSFSPDGKRIVSGGEKLTVWDAENGEEVITLKGHKDLGMMTVTCVTFSPDGKRIVSGSGDKTLKIWNAENREEISRR